MTNDQINLMLPRRTMMLLVGIILLTAAGITALVYLPAAAVTLTPAVSEKTVEQIIVLSTQASEPDFVQYVLPAKLLEAEVKQEQTFNRPGSVTRDEFAKGEVQLINNRDEVQELLPKTHLRHQDSGVFFLTDFPVAIPAHGATRMAVTAKEKGAAGNVGAGRFVVDKLPADLQSDIYGESKAAFTGGVAVETPLSAEEIAKAKEEVLAAASEKARMELSSQAGGAPVRAELTNVAATEEIVSAQEGSKAQTFTVTTTVHARAFLVDQNDLLSLTLLGLRGASQTDMEFSAYNPQSFAVKIEQADFDRGEARLVGQLTGTFASKVGPATLDPAALAGLSAEEVKAHFKDNPAVGGVEVKLSPFWVRSVPGRKGSTTVTVAN